MDRNLEKFVYGEQEFQLAGTQCGLCVYRDEASAVSCRKYDRKPPEVVEGKIRCPHLCTTDLLDG